VGSEQITLSYSTNGHTTREVTGNPAAPLKVRDYRYDAAERLTEIDDNGQAIGRYRYDPMGRRVYKETATETMWFIYADEGLIAELQADGTLKRGYGWKPQGLWGTDPLWLADKTGSGQSDWSTHSYHNDHLWTPQRLTDSAGVVSWSGRSEAFGLTTATVNIVDNPLRFPGQYDDRESDTSQNWHRDYLPSRGGYLQYDPVGLAGGINGFGYSYQSPLRYVDTDGRVPAVAFPALCFFGYVSGIASQYGGCFYQKWKDGSSLRDCDRKCSPTPCELISACLTGCIVNMLVPIPVIGSGIAGAATVLLKRVFREFFGMDPCAYFNTTHGRTRPKPLSDFL